VIEGRALLDWGVRGCNAEDSPALEELCKKIARLMAFYRPAAVIFRKRLCALSNHAHAMIRHYQRMVRSEAARHSIPVCIVNAPQIRTFFVAHGCSNKHERAALLGEWFEELHWKVFPARKPWESEPHNTLIFDAAATAIVFLNHS
jgi:hypothetical protein